MGFTKCKDCIYGDCFGGKYRGCLQFTDFGKTHIVTDDFFSITTGKSREEWKIENQSKDKGC